MLSEVTVRLIREDEQERFDELIRTEHYLKNATWVGRRLFYVAEYQGQWVALLSYLAADGCLKLMHPWKRAQQSRAICRPNRSVLCVPISLRLRSGVPGARTTPARGWPRWWHVPRSVVRS